MGGCPCFNRDDQLTSLLYVGAYQPAPCPEHRFHFTGLPTPRLPLDVYTDPFIEDSLGRLSLFVCFVCMWVCACARIPWATTQLVCIELRGLTTPSLFLQTTVKHSVPEDEWWKSGQGQVIIQAWTTLMWANAIEWWIKFNTPILSETSRTDTIYTTFINLDTLKLVCLVVEWTFIGCTAKTMVYGDMNSFLQSTMATFKIKVTCKYNLFIAIQANSKGICHFSSVLLWVSVAFFNHIIFLTAFLLFYLFL